MLRPRKKIAKREIKEDTLVTYYFKAQKLYLRYSKQIQIGLIAVAVVIVLGVFMTRSKKTAETAAAGKLGMIEQYYYMGDYQRIIPELISIKDKFSGTPSAGTSVFFLANSYFSTGNIEQAEKFYQQFVDNYGQNKLFTAASLAGLGACYESKKQYAKAAELYEKAGLNYPDQFSASFYLKDAGRCHVMSSNKTKGKEIYQILIQKYPESTSTQDAQLLVETL